MVRTIVVTAFDEEALDAEFAHREKETRFFGGWDLWLPKICDDNLILLSE